MKDIDKDTDWDVDVYGWNVKESHLALRQYAAEAWYVSGLEDSARLLAGEVGAKAFLHLQSPRFDKLWTLWAPVEFLRRFGSSRKLASQLEDIRRTEITAEEVQSKFTLTNREGLTEGRIRKETFQYLGLPPTCDNDLVEGITPLTSHVKYLHERAVAAEKAIKEQGWLFDEETGKLKAVPDPQAPNRPPELFGQAVGLAYDYLQENKLLRGKNTGWNREQIRHFLLQIFPSEMLDTRKKGTIHNAIDNYIYLRK